MVAPPRPATCRSSPWTTPSSRTKVSDRVTTDLTLLGPTKPDRPRRVKVLTQPLRPPLTKLPSTVTQVGPHLPLQQAPANLRIPSPLRLRLWTLPTPPRKSLSTSPLLRTQSSKALPKGALDVSPGALTPSRTALPLSTKAAQHPSLIRARYKIVALTRLANANVLPLTIVSLTPRFPLWLKTQIAPLPKAELGTPFTIAQEGTGRE